MGLNMKEKQAVPREYRPQKKRPPNRKGKRIYTDEVIDCLRLVWTFSTSSAERYSPLLCGSRCPPSPPGRPSLLQTTSAMTVLGGRRAGPPRLYLQASGPLAQLLQAHPKAQEQSQSRLQRNQSLRCAPQPFLAPDAAARSNEPSYYQGATYASVAFSI